MQIDSKRYFVTAAGCFLIQAIGVGAFVTYGVFFNSLLTEFEWPRAVISGASSTAFILSGIFAVLVGRFNDIYGPRVLMSITACFFGAGLLLMSVVTQIWQLYVFYGVIFGLGLSSIDVIALTTTARWFSRSRGAMTGIVKVGTGAGQFAIPFLASLLIAAYGWRNTYIILGVFTLASLLLIGQILKRDPGQIGKSREERRVSKSGQQQGRENDSGLSSSEAMWTSQMWLLCIITVITEFCLLTILVHIVPHASDLGLTSTQAAGVLSTIGAVSMIGRFLSGISIDRFGCKPIAIVCFLVLVSSLVWLLAADNIWMLYLFGSVYGLAHGSFFTFISPIVVEIFGLAAHGAIFGIIVFSGTVGGSIGPVVAGYYFDMSDSYIPMFKMLAGLSVLVLVLVLKLNPVAKKKIS